MHDGSLLQLNKLATDWNPEDRLSVVNALQKARVKQEILTGLLYVNTEWKDLHGTLNTCETPLNKLKKNDLCPGEEVLKEINLSFR
jgi:2-oxoglutarate/2-oxoacid ferredoxin oxidoreductase subunit beta